MHGNNPNSTLSQTNSLPNSSGVSLTDLSDEQRKLLNQHARVVESTMRDILTEVYTVDTAVARGDQVGIEINIHLPMGAMITTVITPSNVDEDLDPEDNTTEELENVAMQITAQIVHQTMQMDSEMPVRAS